jgi:hypothetical protein
MDVLRELGWVTELVGVRPVWVTYAKTVPALLRDPGDDFPGVTDLEVVGSAKDAPGARPAPETRGAARDEEAA